MHVMLHIVVSMDCVIVSVDCFRYSFHTIYRVPSSGTRNRLVPEPMAVVSMMVGTYSKATLCMTSFLGCCCYERPFLQTHFVVYDDQVLYLLEVIPLCTHHLPGVIDEVAGCSNQCSSEAVAVSMTYLDDCCIGCSACATSCSRLNLCCCV